MKKQTYTKAELDNLLKAIIHALALCTIRGISPNDQLVKAFEELLNKTVKMRDQK